MWRDFWQFSEIKIIIHIIPTPVGAISTPPPQLGRSYTVHRVYASPLLQLVDDPTKGYCSVVGSALTTLWLVLDYSSQLRCDGVVRVALLI